jgi:hypothetical protein
VCSVAAHDFIQPVEWTIRWVQVEVVGVVTPWRWREHGPLKCCYPTANLRGVTTQKTSNSVFTAVKASSLVFGG